MSDLSTVEQDYQNFIDKYLRVLDEQIKPVNKVIGDSIDRTLNNDLSNEEIQREKEFTLAQLSKLLLIFTVFASQLLPLAFNDSAINVNVNIDTTDLDKKALGILLKDTINDFKIVINESKSYLATFFEFSKQGVLTENQMSQMIATGLIDKGTGQAGQRLIRSALSDNLTENLFDKITKDERRYRAIRYAEINSKNVSDKVKEKLMAEFEAKFRDEKYLQLIDKNGKVRHYQIKDYSEMVARTRMGDSQVMGTIQAGQQTGFYRFIVTSHNTSTPICKPHEGQVYTTDRNDTKYPYMDSSRQPVYHVNCQHRLMVFVE